MSYFYARGSAARYDTTVTMTSESYQLAHSILLRLLEVFVQESAREQGRKICIVDIGCGTGVNVEKIINLAPDVVYRGFDLSEDMLHLFRCKHGKLLNVGPKSDPQIQLIVGDARLETDLLEAFRNPDHYEFIVISSFLFHHFSFDLKKGIYSTVQRNLGTRPRFLILDLFDYVNPRISHIAMRQEISWITQSFDCKIDSENDPEIRSLLANEKKQWLEHFENENIPLPVGWQPIGRRMRSEEDALLEVGFSSATCVFRFFQSGIIVASS